MKKITSIFILICLLFTPALTSSASAHDYDYVYTDVNIITPDSFEDIFSETEADRASFTYEMATLNSSRAVVAMEIELKVGSDYYTTIVSGDIPAYTLPSGDTLYEGPISGTMTVHEDEYRVTAGFSKLESTGGVLVSITMQGNSTMVAFSFGENLIQGEVLDFFMEKSGSGQQNNTAGSNVIGNLDSDEFGNNPGDTASPMVIDPPGFFPIINPGPEYPNIGEYNSYVFQSRDYHMWTSSYYGLESFVYWDETRNMLLVISEPYSYQTNSYASTLSYNSTVCALDYFEVVLSLVPNAEPSKIARIATSYIPEDSNNNIISTIFADREFIGSGYFDIFLKGLLKDAGVNVILLEEIIKDIGGDITIFTSNDYSYRVKVDVGINADLLDDVEPGFPIRFDLEKNSETYYVGNTDYTVTVTAKYFTIGETIILGQEPQYTYFYLTAETLHENDTITLS